MLIDRRVSASIGECTLIWLEERRSSLNESRTDVLTRPRTEEVRSRSTSVRSRTESVRTMLMWSAMLARGERGWGNGDGKLSWRACGVGAF